MTYAHLEFMLPNETVTKRQLLYPYSMKDASPYLDKNKGSAYFVPHGFQPILVPNNDDDTTIQALLNMTIPTMKVSVPLKQALLPHYIIRPSKRHKAAKQAKPPPRPPNAFILYRKNQQAHILRQNANLCNNDVSRIIGNMWNDESPQVKQRFHRLAEEMKEQHRAMYPMYRYCPRKALKRKRQTKTQSSQDTVTMQPLEWTNTINSNSPFMEIAPLDTQNLTLEASELETQEFTTAPLWA
ncbi:hypothetical protein PCANB_000845 [Pneumocystis canis]|nr:hypothetical protein PCK1_000838 [Pneumocystis canis]KAG5437414.1 hypothetical protein PCANB_000845 [Pneumocystis canis]